MAPLHAAARPCIRRPCTNCDGDFLTRSPDSPDEEALREHECFEAQEPASRTEPFDMREDHLIAHSTCELATPRSTARSDITGESPRRMALDVLSPGLISASACCRSSYRKITLISDPDPGAAAFRA